MKDISRKEFIKTVGLMGTSMIFFNGCDFGGGTTATVENGGVSVTEIESGEDLFAEHQAYPGRDRY